MTAKCAEKSARFEEVTHVVSAAKKTLKVEK